MKINAAIPCFLLLCVSATGAFGQAPAASSGQPEGQTAGQSAPTTGAGAADAGAASGTPVKIDPVKEADIRKLLDLAGGTAAVNQVMDGMQANLKTSLANSLPPGDYRDKLVDLFFEKFRSKADIKQLMDLSVQVYDKYLTDDDVKGLIAFYSTPLGKKTISVLPKATVEMQTAGFQWGQNLGRESMREVLQEHPELTKALQDAQKGGAAVPRQ